MLKKCLTYDLKASLLIWSILSAAVLVMSTVGGFAIKTLVLELDGIVFGASILCVFVYYILGIVYLIAGIGLGIYRFYQSFRTDEAYLTFTLPVKRKTLLHSKMLSTAILFISTIAVILIALIISFSIVPDGEGSMLSSALTSIGDGLKESYMANGFWTVVYIAQGVILGALALSAVMLFCFSIAMRTSGNKTRSKLGIGKNLALVFLVYVGIGAMTVPIVLLIATIVIYTDALAIAGTVSQAESGFIIFLSLIMFTMLAVIINVFLYKDNLAKITRKLNLT